MSIQKNYEALNVRGYYDNYNTEDAVVRIAVQSVQGTREGFGSVELTIEEAQDTIALITKAIKDAFKDKKQQKKHEKKYGKVPF